MKNKKIIVSTLIIIIVLLIISFIMLNQDSNNNTVNDNMDSNEFNTIGGSETDMNDNEFISKINISINGVNYTATLEDNETTREFINRLPLELDMNELNGNEKYYYFDSSLPSNSERIGRIQSGDLMLYGSDCFVLFYESFNSSYSYTRIGKIDDPSSLKDVVKNENIKILMTK